MVRVVAGVPSDRGGKGTRPGRQCLCLKLLYPPCDDIAWAVGSTLLHHANSQHWGAVSSLWSPLAPAAIWFCILLCCGHCAKDNIRTAGQSEHPPEAVGSQAISATFCLPAAVIRCEEEASKEGFPATFLTGWDFGSVQSKRRARDLFPFGDLD